MDIHERTRALLGAESVELLHSSHVLVFGIGGVGAACIEALTRCGVGNIGVVDYDSVSVSNINRQLIATTETVGMKKTEAIRKRIELIDPDINVITYDMMFLPENADMIPFDQYDYVIDAIDTISAKIEIAVRCRDLCIPLISCMGTGNRVDPSLFTFCDIFETKNDPVARIMRHELRKRGIESLTVLFSSEKPNKADKTISAPASVSFVPPVAGMLLAGKVIRQLTGRE